MKKILFTAILLFLCGTLFAQNTISQYGQGMSATGMDNNRYDRNGNPIDTTSVIDANTVPVGLNAWKIDTRFGEMTPVPVDTLQHGFQNSNDTGVLPDITLIWGTWALHVSRMYSLSGKKAVSFSLPTHTISP